MSVCRINFYKGGKTYYFSYDNLELRPSQFVIVETVKGLEMGVVKAVNQECPEEYVDALKPVVRIATPEDISNYNENEKCRDGIIAKAKEIINANKLQMKVVDAEYSLDRAKLLISFESDERVDFRQLVKDLAQEFKTRIELRQIGPRDSAKKIGGIGPCGYTLCCHKFINDFENVSIKMAKTQNLSLNPQKISGTCGKLLCCLKNENENYELLREGMPEVNDTIEVEEGMAKVFAVDLLKQQVRAKKLEDDGFIVVELPKIKRIISRKNKENA